MDDADDADDEREHDEEEEDGGIYNLSRPSRLYDASLES